MGHGMKPKAPDNPRKQTAAPFIGPPIDAIERLESASVKDLSTARLTLGLLESITRLESRMVFPDYRPSVFDLRQLPNELQECANALVRWALNADRGDIAPIYQSANRIAVAVRQMRLGSPLGKRYRRQANRLMRQYPAPLKPNWTESIDTYDLMRGYRGKPLTGRIIFMLKPFKPQVLQIVPHDAYLNSTWAPGALTIRLNEDGYTIHSITLALEIPKQVPVKGSRTIRGPLLDFFETGSEGVIWMIDDENRRGREALEPICEGDHLTILDQMGKTLWRGTIHCDKKTGWRTYPKNPEYGQQCALGHWIHWVQKGFAPDDWARYFIRPDCERYHGILIRRRGPTGDPTLGPNAA